MEKVLVKNRSAAMVFYKVPDMGIKREFLPNEVKDVTKEELVKLKELEINAVDKDLDNGTIAFLKTCLNMILFSDGPFALAYLT